MVSLQFYLKSVEGYRKVGRGNTDFQFYGTGKEEVFGIFDDGWCGGRRRETVRTMRRDMSFEPFVLKLTWCNFAMQYPEPCITSIQRCLESPKLLSLGSN